MGPLAWAFILLGIAFLLVVIDLLVPSAGILSMFAALAVIASIVVAFTAGVRQGAMMVILITILVPVVLAAAVRWWPHTPIGKLVLIPRPEHPDDVLPESGRGLDRLVGRVGKAKSKLLPSGAVAIDGQIWDALSAGKPIEKNQPVKVVAIRNGRLVVRRASASDLQQQPEEPAAQDGLLARPIEELGIDAIDDPLA